MNEFIADKREIVKYSRSAAQLSDVSVEDPFISSAVRVIIDTVICQPKHHHQHDTPDHM